MENLTSAQIELLKKPLPDEAIKQHPTKTYLSSIKAIYVTERLNEVFGIGAWTTKVKEVKHNESNGMVVVLLIFEVPKYGIYYESFGGNDNGGSNNKNFDLGDAYKGASTDALTKIASFLEIGIDVFKGKGDINPKSKVKIDVWLNDNQFAQAKSFTKQQIANLLAKYNGTTPFEDGKIYSMKKAFRDELSKMIK